MIDNNVSDKDICEAMRCRDNADRDQLRKLAAMKAYEMCTKAYKNALSKLAGASFASGGFVGPSHGINAGIVHSGGFVKLDENRSIAEAIMNGKIITIEVENGNGND